MRVMESALIRHTSAYLAVITALLIGSNVEALELNGSDVYTVTASESLGALQVWKSSDPEFSSMATLGFQYTGTPINLDLGTYSTFIDNNIGCCSYKNRISVDEYTSLGNYSYLGYFRSKSIRSNLLNIELDPALLGTASGVRITADDINGVATASLPPLTNQILDQTVLNGKEFLTYDNDSSDGRYGIVSATTKNTFAGTNYATDNIFMTADETTVGSHMINSLALDEGVTVNLGGDVSLGTGKLLFSSNATLNGNITAGPFSSNTNIYVTGAGNHFNGQIKGGFGAPANYLTIDGGDGLIAELSIGAQQSVDEVNLAEINLNLTVDNVFQGADVYLTSNTGWTGFQAPPESGSLNIGSTYQRVKSINSGASYGYGSARLYGDGTLHAEDLIALAFPSSTDPVNANLYSNKDMYLIFGTYNGELRARNLAMGSGDVYGDISDLSSVTATNATFSGTRLHGVKTYSGSTTVLGALRHNKAAEHTEFGSGQIYSGSLDLKGDAALANSSSMLIGGYRGSSVKLFQDDASGVVNRLNDNMRVEFDNIGRFTFDAQSFTGDAYERIGDVSTAGGYGKLEVFAGDNGTATLSVGNIETGSNNLLFVDADAGGRILADSVDGDASDHLLKGVFVKVADVDVADSCWDCNDATNFDIPGFAELKQGEIIAAQVSNININNAVSSQLVHIDSSTDGVLTDNRSVRGMMLGGLSSPANLTGDFRLEVGEGGILFLSSATIDSDLHMTNGGRLQSYTTSGAHINGRLTGELDIAGPGSVYLNNANNDVSSLTLRGGRLQDFKTTRNNLNVSVTDGGILNRAVLGGTGQYTGSIAVDGKADITITDVFSGTLNINSNAYDDYSSFKVDRINGAVIQLSDGTHTISSKAANVPMDIEGALFLETSDDARLYVENEVRTSSNTGFMFINNKSTRSIQFGAAVENNGQITIGNNASSIYWNVDNRGWINSARGELSGSITNTASSSLQLTDAINNGVIDNTAGGVLNIQKLTNNSQILSDTITHSGSIDNQTGGTIDVAGAFIQENGIFENHGELQTDSMVVNGGSVIIAANDVGADGAIHVTNDYVHNAGSLNVNGDLFATTLNLNGGVLTGSGTIHADIQVNGGQINPGNSPGTLIVEGDLFLDEFSYLTLEIDGTALGQYDRLLVGGNFDVLGGITFDLGFGLDETLFTSGISGFSLEDMFLDMTENSLNLAILASNDMHIRLDGGDMFSLNLDDDGSGGFVTTVSAVPVPAAVWLFGSGLIGLVGFARRKKA